MSVLVKEVIEKLRLDIVYGEPELLEKEINTADITRPGLEMTGYFDYYTPERIQLLGMNDGMTEKSLQAKEVNKPFKIPSV